ncbi:hypothetical protein ACFFX1_10750 [Dactylosporangium sucinum]|uniref:Uncharacterized protein n=1 Tax=Dactylosporangium sucinum TaxID=1424081 RepID=A0A917THF6_9ACTN|nr:hypothetical protein [Dactylosporangium sucinum]GGM23052.1 hypothetical protein GCM10007977_025320 [Dactylosporangium sucinum]
MESDLVPLTAALRHQLRYLAARWQLNDDHVDGDVFARYTVARSPVGSREITLLTRRPRARWDPGHDEVGHLAYRICDLCQLGAIIKIRTAEEWKRRGYATWMLDRSFRAAPGFTWTTTRQMSDARAFWDFVIGRTPGQYRPKKPCRHIQASFRRPGCTHWRAARPV